MLLFGYKSLCFLEVEALLSLQKHASFRSKISYKHFYNINLNRLLVLYSFCNTSVYMIVDHSGRLHMGITNSRTKEFETSFFHIRADAV